MAALVLWRGQLPPPRGIRSAVSQLQKSHHVHAPLLDGHLKHLPRRCCRRMHVCQPWCMSSSSSSGNRCHCQTCSFRKISRNTSCASWIPKYKTCLAVCMLAIDCVIGSLSRWPCICETHHLCAGRITDSSPPDNSNSSSWFMQTAASTSGGSTTTCSHTQILNSCRHSNHVLQPSMSPYPCAAARRQNCERPQAADSGWVPTSCVEGCPVWSRHCPVHREPLSCM